MKTLTPVEIMEGVIALEDEGFPIEKLAEFIAHDCVVHEAQTLPFGGEWVGPQGFLDLMYEVRNTFPNFKFELDALITDGERYASIKARISGDTPGGRFSVPLVEFWTFENNKAVDVLAVWHDTGLVMQLYNSKAA